MSIAYVSHYKLMPVIQYFRLVHHCITHVHMSFNSYGWVTERAVTWDDYFAVKLSATFSKTFSPKDTCSARGLLTSCIG